MPARCDRKWFAETFCGGEVCLDSIADSVAAGRSVWPFVSRLMAYDMLAMLAVHPTSLGTFFEVSGTHTSRRNPSLLAVRRCSRRRALSVVCVCARARVLLVWQVELKVVRGTEHIVVGASDDRPGVRDAHKLRSFLMNALRHALAESHTEALIRRGET